MGREPRLLSLRVFSNPGTKTKRGNVCPVQFLLPIILNMKNVLGAGTESAGPLRVGG